MKIIDMHTHLLPCIDDGAANEEETYKMLKMMKEYGVTDVCLTPHFYAHRISMEGFLRQRRTSFALVKEYFKQFGIVPHIGAEVMFSRGLFVYEDISPLCIDGGEYVLIEFSENFDDFDEIMENIYKLVANFSVTPIIAHIDRFPRLLKEEYLEKLCSEGCTVQMNAEAILNRRIHKKLKKFIDDGLIHVVGSDCHDPVHRKPDIDCFRQYAGEDVFAYFMQNAQEVLEA